MRRTDLINSIQKVGTVLKETKVSEALFSSQSKKGDIEGLLSIFQDYTSQSKEFTDDERKILKIFELNTLDDPKLWTRIFSANEAEARDAFMKIRMGIRYFTEFLPNLIELLKQDHVNYYTDQSHHLIKTAKPNDKVLLTVILPEQDNEISSPERLIKVLDSISQLYNAFSVIENLSDSDLSVAAIDSGSDKSFDFLGAAKLMEAVKELIIGLWDRVVFFREKKLSERLELISKSLPIIEKINEMQANGSVSPEQAEILRRNITNAANNFIVAGAIIPELSNYTTFSPRKLMAPEPKLLTNSDADTTEKAHQSTNTENTDDISDEEVEAMKKIIAKRSKKKP